MAKPKNPFKKKSSKEKSTKKEQASAGEESPLMAGSGGPSSTAGADAQREARRKEREGRRQERSERRAKNNPASVNPAPELGAGSKTKPKPKVKNNPASVNPAPELGAGSKTKPKPKVSRREQMAKDAKLGCCHKFGTLLVKLVHVLDALIGLTFLVYGLLIMTQFEQPAMEAAIATLAFGAIMLLASVMGVVGFYSPRCKRIGLLVSAYLSPIIVICYIFAVIFELSESSSVFDYLTEHMDVLYLDEGEIATLEQILPFFYVVVAALIAIEICR